MDHLPVPENEKLRLAALKNYEILDSLDEAEFDRLTKLASLICGVPIALVSLIDKDRQWFKSKVGLEVSQTPRDISFCQFAIIGDSVFQVEDATNDERFKNNPLVTGQPDIRFYAGYPLIDPNGFALGTLCVIDQKPKKLTEDQLKALNLLAEEVVSQIVSRKKEKERDEFEKLFNLSVDMICIASKEGFFKKINPAFIKYLGWSEKELLGEPFIDKIYPEDIIPTMKAVERLFSGENFINIENRYIAKNGKVVNINWIANSDPETGDLFAVGRDITEEKISSERLIRLSQFKDVIINGTDYSIIATNPAGIITSFNKGAEKMLGYDAEEIINKVTPAILHDIDEVVERTKVLKKELNEDFEPGFETFVKKSKLGKADVNEWTYYRKDKSKLTVELSVTTLRDSKNEITGYMGIARDITEKKLWERKLVASEENHRAFFENTQGLMCTHDLNGNFLTINPAGSSLLGYTIDEILKKSLFDLVAPSEKKLVQEYLDIIISTGHFKGLMKVIHKDGSIRTWMYNNVVASKEDDTKYVIGNATDFTERILMEKQLKREKIKAEENARAKDIFLANMSHEIRTPMNAIIGFGNLLKDSSLDKEQFENVSIVTMAAENLLGIINDILDFSKIESGKISLESTPFSIKSIIKNIDNLLSVKAKEKNLQIEFMIDSKVPDYVLGDPTRINQILINLINNAIKFTQLGSVKVFTTLKEEKEENYLINFEVIDTGIGIDEQKLSVIFERFTQANSETTRKFGGTGLGLSISKSLVEILGGNMFVKSVVNQGSVFSAQIPFKKVTKEAIKKVENDLTKFSSPSNIKVLLVEDNNFNQKLALKVVAGFGFSIDLAENGKEAVRILKEKNDYSVILMDLQMPEMDGYEATKYIRNQLSLNIPIIAMTAHSLVGEKEKCINIGMNDYISKPFSKNDLYNKILKYSSGVELETSPDIALEVDDQEVILNLNYLKELSGGSIEFEKDMISLFVNQVPGELEIIKTAILSNDFRIIKTMSHKLKSSFSLIGVKGGMELSLIENKSDIGEQMDEIKLLFEKVTEYTKEALLLLKKELE